jgi:[ribosomal protein S18]-alanine N-acetyltransferase
MSNLVIRRAGLDDLPHVMTVMQTAFSAEYGEAWSNAQCAGILTLPGSVLFVSFLGETPVAFALIRAVGEDAELLLIGVANRAQRKGYGRLLLDRVITEARNLGVSNLFLEVRSGNPAISLYRATGFERVGLRRDYYRGKSGQMYDAETHRVTIACVD